MRDIIIINMREQSIFSFLYQILVAELCICFAAGVISTRTVILCLGCACVLALKLLFAMMFKDGIGQFLSPVLPVALSLCCVAVLLYFEAAMFPLCCLLVTELCVYAFRERFIIFSMILCALLCGTLTVLRPDPLWFGVAVLTYLFAVFGYSLFARLDSVHEQLLTRSDEIKELGLRAQQQRQASRALEDAARVEERNRLAARIHDDVGHGVSGSILLLDGALRMFDSDADAAKTAIETAADNLRRSVDDIRMALRDERSDGTKSGLSRIKAELSRFETAYPQLSARLVTDGDLSQIRPELWSCVYDNMLEALTNTLKHTSANRFDISVRQRDKLITVEFSDNGAYASRRGISTHPARKGVGGATATGRATERKEQADSREYSAQTAVGARGGMGLINMEERCALCGGKFFVNREEDGFHIVMTFPERRTV